MFECQRTGELPNKTFDVGRQTPGHVVRKLVFRVSTEFLHSEFVRRPEVTSRKATEKRTTGEYFRTPGRTRYFLVLNL